MQTQENTAEAPGVLDGADTLAPGMLAGPWRIERELGRGGMGTVYAVVHSEIGKHAALKVVHRRLVVPGDPHHDRMLLEAQVVNRVGHPNIVDIFETGQLPDGRHYLVMERLDGQPLAHRADDGKLPPDDVIAILLQICDALIAAHAAGVIHRDLKLDNVFLVDNPDDPSTPRVKLLDWGIAKAIDHAGPRHTIDGQLVGTPQYLAPEQARGSEVSSKTDVYSLGVMAYELFVDQLPFEAETAAEIMTMHLRATPPPASDLWPEIPPQLEDLLHEMLAKNATHRPSMLDVARRLEAIRPIFRADKPPAVATPLRRRTSHGAPPALDAPPWPAKPRWQWVVGGSAIAILAMLFVVSERAESVAAAAIHEPGTHEPLAPARLLSTRPTILPDPPRVVQVAPDVATATPVVEAAPTAAPASRHSVKRSSRYGKHQALYRAAKLAPAAPRRNAKQDPDGTFDPYE